MSVDIISIPDDLFIIEITRGQYGKCVVITENEKITDKKGNSRKTILVGVSNTCATAIRDIIDNYNNIKPILNEDKK